MASLFQLQGVIFHPMDSLRLFQRKAPPPKAQSLRRVGIIRTVSNDGGYVIIELEPGVQVATGRELVVTGTGGEPALLRVAELQPPYFVADVVSGHPPSGAIVQQ